MAQTPFSLLLLRRLSLSRLSNSARPLSSSTSSEPSLSSRMSFVFDQIDALEKERSEKDETVHKIRAWRESKKALPQTPTPELVSELSARADLVSDLPKSTRKKSVEESVGDETKNEVEVVHPWPEWIELMERLVQQNYFDHRRRDEDKMLEDLGFGESKSLDSGDRVLSGLDFKNYKLVLRAADRFGNDRFDIFRSISQQDIQTLVGFGCPSNNKFVVDASKVLRKYVHLDEGDVCSNCSLRSSCKKAYLLPSKEEHALFRDVVCVLFEYGYDPYNKAALNPSPMKEKSVKTVVRKLLHQIVRLSSNPRDPNLPPPIIRMPPKKVKQPPPLKKKRVGRDDIEMKQGDWLCTKCDFMNFAKNNVCLQCDAGRPKRQLLPGEWECDQCNFLNYRRNVVCFHCENKRPHEEYTEFKSQVSQEVPRMNDPGKIMNRSEVSKAWNFDFDDDESDGADVAAFENADFSAMKNGPFNNNQARVGILGKPEHFNEGFDDFDEEDDDVDGNEINRSRRPIGSDNNLRVRGENRQPYNSQSKPTNRRPLSGSENGDDIETGSGSERIVKPKWQSSHVADSRPRVRGSMGPSNNLSLDSDDEHDFDSDMDGQPIRDSRGPNNFNSSSRGRNTDSFSGSDSEIEKSFSGSDSEIEELYGSKPRGRNESGTRSPYTSSRSKGFSSGSDSEFKDSYGNRSRESIERGPKGRNSLYKSSLEKGCFSGSDSEVENSYGFGSRGDRGSGGTNFRTGGQYSRRRKSSQDNIDDFGGSSRGSRGGRESGGRIGKPIDFEESLSEGFRQPRGGHGGGGKKEDFEVCGRDNFKNSRRVIER